ncbi:dTMP kinase [Halothiobacillus diazotrophicus]|uniref:Thymidylate kinase n=1 Tax=Halothiobacillus diazotrophicus TaxID=1860122 RepID=A0A191ZGE3_9GAMM|nr:dTMP kinase [Halothiobacillus diazotrophicus]ANJ66925.1 dTMP kinase [Halothiobacillus diazotrophicus]
MTAQGVFITIEGIEGAGKSTAVSCVADWFSGRGREVLRTREPGGTPVAEDIRRILLTATEEELAEPTELLLMFAARAQHVARGIRPALDSGRVVVCDRFTDSSRAYQGAGRGIDPVVIESLASYAEQGVRPDLTLLLDLPVGIGIARAAARRGMIAKDRFEREAHEFFGRVRAGFLAIAEAHPRRVRVIDAAEPLDRVRLQIHAALAARFDEGEVGVHGGR